MTGSSFTMHRSLTWKQRTIALGSLLIAGCLFVLLNARPSHAFTCTWLSASNSNWNTAANWTGCNSTVPKVGDSVVITSGTSTIVDANFSVSSVSTTGNIYLGANRLTVTSTLQLNPTANINAASGGSFYVSTTANLFGAVTGTTGVIQLDGTPIIWIGGAVSSTSGTLNFGSVSSSGTISSNTGNMFTSSTVQNNGTWTIGTGTATTTGAVTNGALGTINGVSGRWTILGGFTNSGTFNAQTGIVRLNGSSSYNVTGVTFNNLELTMTNATATIVTSNATVGGVFSATTTNGTINAAALNFTVSGASFLNGGVVTSTSGTLTFTGAVTSSGAIGYTSGGIRFSSASNYQNNGILDIGSGNTTSVGALVNAGGATINGRTGLLTLETSLTNSGSFLAQSGTTEYQCGGTETVGPVVYNNLRFPASDTCAITGNLSASTTVTGTLSVTSGNTVAIGSNTFTVLGTPTNSGTISLTTGSLVHVPEAVQITNSGFTQTGSFTTPATLYFQVQDSARNLLGGTIETVTTTVSIPAGSGGDSETVVLTETSASSGIFRSAGISAVTSNAASAGNHQIEITSTNTATESYSTLFNNDNADSSSTTASITYSTASTGGGGGGGGGGYIPVITTTVSQPTGSWSLSVPVHALVKLPDDGNPNTQMDSAVYYVGSDGMRHAFPNSKVYSTWYYDFSGVRVVSPSDLAAIPLGANVTYKPGERMVKFITDPKVYVVDKGGLLHWVKTEALAQSFYGSTWNKMIDDVSDAFYANYKFGSDINTASDYNPQNAEASESYISDGLK